MAEEKKYILSGHIMDTSDNLLPEVRVALKKSKVITKTDGNGKFKLSFSPKKPLKADRAGTIELLEVDVEGHLGQTIPIKDMSFFSKPVEVKLKPNPIGEDNVGFSVRMSMNNVVGRLRGKLGRRKWGTYIEPAAYEKVFSKIKESDKVLNTDRAWFYVYVPKNVKKVKAAFYISLHGMGTIDDPLLRDFASKNDLALVAVNGNPVQRGCYPVSSMDKQIKRLATLVKHPELADVPFFTFGHSNGTGFSAMYASQRPEKVIGWISYHSGASYHLLFPNVEKVPGLVMHGQLDKFLNAKQDQNVQNLRSKRNAAVNMMMEGNVGHGPVNKDATWAFIIEFCKAAMRIRLGKDGKLKPVKISEGWLGGIYDREKGGQQELPIAPYDKYQGDKSIANWLPDEEFAKIWQEYGKTHPRHGKK